MDRRDAVAARRQLPDLRVRVSRGQLDDPQLHRDVARRARQQARSRTLMKNLIAIATFAALTALASGAQAQQQRGQQQGTPPPQGGGTPSADPGAALRPAPPTPS